MKRNKQWELGNMKKAAGEDEKDGKEGREPR